MRRSIAILIAVLAGRATPARAIDVHGELTVAREFVYAANGVESEFADEQLALGAGLTMVSDYRIERYGAQGLIEYRGEHVSAGIGGDFGPRQDGRGWASLDPHAALQYDVRRWHVALDGGVLLRRFGLDVRHGAIDLDQLQLHAEVEITFGDCWRVSALGLYSFYDPDPARSPLRGVDLGLVVTLAGKPERWAAAGVVARRAGRKTWLELGLAGVTYADGRGVGLVPRGAIRLGAWRGFSVAAALETIVAVPPATGPVREMGTLELEYER